MRSVEFAFGTNGDFDTDIKTGFLRVMVEIRSALTSEIDFHNENRKRFSDNGFSL
jgi:hypothetical protein